MTIKEAFKRAKNIFNENIRKLIKFTRGDTENDMLCLVGEEKNDDDIFDYGHLNEDIFSAYNENNIIKDIYDEYEDDNMKKNNIYFRKNPFRNEEQKNEDKIEERKYMRYFKFPGIDSLRPDNFQRLINKGVH